LDVSLYFHVPFCTKKCPYCHFYVIPNQARYHHLLSEGFGLEWNLQKERLASPDLRIVSVYFGGGTPTLLDAQEIHAVIQRCGPLSPDCEITIEANPEDHSLSHFRALKKAGINRISFGVQSLDDRSLAILGRAHTRAGAKMAITTAAKAGFDNISIDLMYDLPDQTESSWRYTLEQIKELEVQHLSLYNLTIEPHTSFYKRREKLILPKPETSLRLLSGALTTFEALGFERYEISAFAKPGFASKHNMGYWTFRPFLGFGPSAFSYWNGERFQNTPNLQRYSKALQANLSPVHFRETLPYPQNLREQIAVGLRLKNGCVVPDNAPEETKIALEKLQGMGLIIQKGLHIQLTEKGKLFYDSVAAEIV
jgi:oxygen-independent coproporphyrinogen-3 oxidase